MLNVTLCITNISADITTTRSISNSTIYHNVYPNIVSISKLRNPNWNQFKHTECGHIWPTIFPAFYHILWIFYSTERCASSVSLDIPYIFYQIRSRRYGVISLRLQSSKFNMRHRLLPLPLH